MRLEWRVGIHVDDVMVEGNNIMGSGVNVAARLESQCKPGQILVSRIVKDQVSKRVDFSIDADGTRELKNISSDFEVFIVGDLSNQDDDFLTKESKKSNQNNIVISFVGEGTLGEGVLYESLNLSSILDSPHIFVLENNLYSQSTNQAEAISGEILDRPKAFNIQTFETKLNSLNSLIASWDKKSSIYIICFELFI